MSSRGGFLRYESLSDFKPLSSGILKKSRGFSVVPWKRRRGYATLALQLLLPHVRKEGLSYVELTTDPGNVASQRVIAANGGRLVERFNRPAIFGGAEALRFRILLA